MSVTDPRAIRSRQAILEAVRWIVLNEGPDRVTHQRVAEVSGVGRATVYRHWSTGDDMVFALLDEDPFFLLGDSNTNTLEQRLIAWLTWMAELISEPGRRLVLLHVFARTEFDTRAQRLRERRLTELVTYLTQALGTESKWTQLPLPTKMDGISLLIGPVMAQVFFLSRSPGQAWIKEVANTFLSWLEDQAE